MSISVINVIIKRGINGSVKKHVLSDIQNRKKKKTENIQDAILVFRVGRESMSSLFTRVDSRVVNRSFYMEIFYYLYRERIVITSHGRLSSPTLFLFLLMITSSNAISGDSSSKRKRERENRSDLHAMFSQ